MRRHLSIAVLASALLAPGPPAVAAVSPSISFTAPAAVIAGGVLTVVGEAKPAVFGRSVQLWEQRGNGWVAVADSYQSHTGTFVIRVRADTVGEHTYRAVTTTAAPAYSVRARTRVVATTPSTGVRTTYLSDVTPLGGVVGFYGSPYTGVDTSTDAARAASQAPSTATGSRSLAGRAYPKSVETTSRSLSWALGAEAGTFAATIGLVDTTRDMPVHGPRVVEVRVDGELRLRRTLQPDAVMPVVVDVQGARTVSVLATSHGYEPNPIPSDLVLGTPLVTSRSIAQRNIDAGTAVSELRPTSTAGGVLLNQNVGYTSGAMLGGSIMTAKRSASGVVARADYDLGGRFTTLTGSPAAYVEVTSPPAGARIDVYGDGRLLASLGLPTPTGGIGELQRVDVTGVRALSIRFDSPDGSSVFGEALGDPGLR